MYICLYSIDFMRPCPENKITFCPQRSLPPKVQLLVWTNYMGACLHFLDVIRPNRSPKVFNSHNPQILPTPIPLPSPSHLSSALFDNPPISPTPNNTFQFPKNPTISHHPTSEPIPHLSQIELSDKTTILQPSQTFINTGNHF